MEVTNYVADCRALERFLSEQSFDYETELSKALKDCPSQMDAYDLIFGFVFGCLGATLNTNEKVADFLDKVHEASNSDNPSSPNKIIEFLARILKHKGDWMDKVPVVQEDGTVISQFVNRSAEEVAKGVWEGTRNTPHRIFWGHDIFSFNQDNPFLLEIRQYGFWQGILQAIRHLIADTCSKQGLPIPTSSWWDKAAEDGKRTNGLLDFCQKYSEEAFEKRQPGANNQVFNHLFSIHMQDVLANGVTNALVWAYCKARDILDDERKSQIQIVALTTNLMGSATIGFVTTGIPQINWICFGSLVKSFYKLFKSSNDNIQLLAAKTESLFSETERLEVAVAEKRKDIEHDIIRIMDNSDDKKQGRSRLIESFGGHTDD